MRLFTTCDYTGAAEARSQVGHVYTSVQGKLSTTPNQSDMAATNNLHTQASKVLLPYTASSLDQFRYLPRQSSESGFARPTVVASTQFSADPVANPRHLLQTYPRMHA